MKSIVNNLDNKHIIHMLTLRIVYGYLGQTKVVEYGPSVLWQPLDTKSNDNTSGKALS